MSVQHNLEQARFEITKLRTNSRKYNNCIVQQSMCEPSFAEEAQLRYSYGLGPVGTINQIGTILDKEAIAIFSLYAIPLLARAVAGQTRVRLLEHQAGMLGSMHDALIGCAADPKLIHIQIQLNYTAIMNNLSDIFRLDVADFLYELVNLIDGTKKKDEHCVSPATSK